MDKKNIAVVYFPGNNCEIETLEAVKAAGMNGKILRWNTQQDLRKFDGYVIPGGWAYEDRVRAGIIAAKDPVMNLIKEEAKKGKPVLGICNGAQVLIETGMVPNTQDKVEFALAPNINPFVKGYYNVWVNMKSSGKNAFTKLFSKNEVLYVPIAHGEGRFITKEKSLVEKLERNGQIAFKYCTGSGKIENKFPVNPNGSMCNIAALSNKEGNVMAMMPHPERAIWQRQFPGSKKEDNKTANLKIFESMKKYLKRK
ncbi:phosphoribosylformylglycinamidine synthase I [Candidatus Woesearchaeota archaeon]|nr:phosphoribosylformylglycinamidine synthase I [Candidatus Woesearchaeota archaeon]